MEGQFAALGPPQEVRESIGSRVITGKAVRVTVIVE
jgi:hypothetical protein